MEVYQNKREILKTKSVLYVEDDDEIQRQLSFFLEKKVGALYTAYNGREGVEMYKKYRPDVVITDIKMPAMDGLKMAKIIRTMNQDVPIIIITAFNEQEYLSKSTDTGIDQYVLKPVNPYLLLDTLIRSFNKTRESK